MDKVATPTLSVIIAAMSPRRLYCSDLKEGLNLLPPEESHHAVSSLRARAGDEFVVFDGRGREASARVERVTRRQTQVVVERITERPFDLLHRITLAVAMTKAHRQGYLIEKCTELGAAAFWPILAERSVVRCVLRAPRLTGRGADPASAAVDKWSRRAVEAAKQSARAWVPTVEAPQTFTQAVARIGEFSAAAIADPDPAGAAFNRFLSHHAPGGSVLVFVGPEGGWSESECREAVGAGAVRIRLSPTVLRSETAAVAVCAAAALYSASNETMK
jgi:16S rRNA (uracil1498-N3)-methyltransferase